MSEALSTTLDDLARGMRVHIASNQPPNLDTCAGLFAALQAAAHAARALEARLGEMEAIARDCDLIAHAKSGEIGPLPLSRDAADPEPVTRPGAASIDQAGSGHRTMVFDVKVGRDGNLVDLREALAREQREIQRALDAGHGTIEQLHARERELAGLDNTVGEERLVTRENACGNDVVIVLPYRSRRRPLTYCGGPQDGGAA